MGNLSRTAAIVGVAESNELGLVPGKSSLQHHAEAAFNALDVAVCIGNIKLCTPRCGNVI